MEKLIKNGGKIWRACTVIGGVFMLISAILIVVNVILRRFFNAPIFGTTEMVQYLGLAITAFAIIENEWGEGNIIMGLFVDMMSRKPRYILNMIEHFIEGVVFVVVDYLLLDSVLAQMARGNLTPELHFPKWIPTAFVLVGFILLTVVVFMKAILYYLAVKKNVEINFEKIARIS